MKKFNLKKTIKNSSDYLKEKNIKNPLLNAEIIISEILNLKRLKLSLDFEREVTKSEFKKIKKAILKRSKNIPIEYIFKKSIFFGMSLKINKNVLIPRAETELLVETALKKIEAIKDPKILEIGVGSGAISIAIAANRKDCQIIACDISKKALKVAKKNIARHKLKNITLVKSDIFKNIFSKNYDLIISNPPYIAEYEYEKIDEGVKKEPKLALVSQNNGYYFYENIIEQGYNYLKKDGILIFEIGYKQAEKIKKIFGKSQYKNVECLKDYGQNDRIVSAKRK